jgi:DNA-binding transcriptional MerR regulator
MNTETPTQPLAVGLDEAARLTGLPANTLRIFARAGRCPSRKVGRRRVYVISELAAWLQEQDRGIRQRDPAA